MNLSSLAGIVVVGGLLAVDGGTPEQAVERTVVYLGATLIDGTGKDPGPEMALVTRGERIISVLETVQVRGAEVVDVHGKFIVPGLVNSHVHLATEGDPASAKAYLLRELYSGVTAVRDMAGDVRLLAELQREALTGEIAAPDIFYAALMAGPEFFKDPRTHSATRGVVAGEAPFMRAITPRTDLRLAVAEARGTGATGVKLYAELPASLVRAITAEAHRQHLLVWAHGYVHPALPREVVAAGVDVVSHVCHLGYDQQTATPASPGPSAPLFLDMKRRGTILDATLSFYDTEESPPARRCAPGVADQIARDAYRAGVAFSVGTDDDADWKSPDSAIDVELQYLVSRAGMTPMDAIRAATLVGARTLGQEKQMGTLEAGKLANFVVLDANPLDDIANVRRVSLVVKRGRPHPRSAYTPLTSPPPGAISR